ncbi:hypothetical protein Tco_1024596 [Tanacetum coccineum]
MSSALVVHSGYAKTPTKKLKIVMDIPSILAPTPFNMFKRVTIDSIPFEQYIANLFSSGSSKAAEEGLLTLEEAKLQMQEVKRLADLKPKKEKSEKKLRKVTFPPKGVVGKAGLVIKEPEAGIFLYNGNFDLVFQRRSEYQLASTTQLIRIQNLINVDSEYAQQVYDELIYEIESRPDFVQAREIVAKNLDGMD